MGGDFWRWASTEGFFFDTAKASALVCSLVSKPDGAASIRDKLADFAAAEGLAI